MAKFLFKLEMLLKHRENIEQVERDALLRIAYKYRVEQGKLDRLILQREETSKELAAKQMKNEPSRELMWYRLYLKRLDLEIAECKKRLMQLEAEVEEQKQATIEASKKRKVLSSLRAKRHKEYVLETEKQEQKEMDEWVTTQFAAKGGSSVESQ